MLFADAFKYKKWANAELLELGERQLEQLPENDAQFFTRILNHTTVVDSLFISRLSGGAERYSADNTRETPTFAQLKARIAQNDAWLIGFAERATADELQRVVSFRFTDGDHGQLSVEEVLLHLLTHGSNHRGMASRTLAIHGLERPKDTFTRYLHEAEPVRREQARGSFT
ncbi:damage-inducible protein DinB [Pseudomonas sp. PA15(2017)]|uniref:DinB family protein n=1 Tax=Pseudomonas sp. PA15(2017) TaxID=1932111 RepID=UPI00096948EA|nr:DinB family protein [Pseudomonas sp. PA15(2017)]OLU23560.1 damage-inducible protein DinB [Pseudomonas sp. PA15(2017)]